VLVSVLLLRFRLGASLIGSLWVRFRARARTNTKVMSLARAGVSSRALVRFVLLLGYG
jgi:hypothetical protein